MIGGDRFAIPIESSLPKKLTRKYLSVEQLITELWFGNSSCAHLSLSVVSDWERQKF